MCEPVTIMTTLAIATTAASIVSEVQSAKAQEKAIRAQLEQTNTEINQKASAEVNDRQRAARREQARIKVAAGEAGLQLGGSIDQLLSDSLMQAGLSHERTSQNRENELLSANAEANSMLSRVERPTILGAGLRLASAGAQGYAQGTSMKINRASAKTTAGRGG